MRRYFVPALTICLYSMAAHASPGWYVGISAGPASLSYKSIIGGDDNRVDDDSSAFSAEVGYRPVRYLAMALAYRDYGDYHGLTNTHCYPGQVCTASVALLSPHLSAWSFAIVPQLPVRGGAGLFVEGGVISWTLDGLSIGGTHQDSGTGLLYGAGVRYDFPAHISLKLKYERTDLDLEQTAVGAEWRF